MCENVLSVLLSSQHLHCEQVYPCMEAFVLFRCTIQTTIHSFIPRGASCCLDNTTGFTTCYLSNAGFTAWRGHYRLIPTVAGDWGPGTMPQSPPPPPPTHTHTRFFPSASRVIFDSNPRTEKAMSFLSFLTHLFSSAFFLLSFQLQSLINI